MKTGEEFVRNKIGAVSLPIRAEGEETSDLAVAAVRKLFEKGLDPSAIDLLILCTQNPDGHGLPHTSAIVHGKLGLPETCAAFDISLGCSGYVYGLTVVDAMLRAGHARNAVLVTADPYSKIVDPDDRDTALLFGDAATASWIVPAEAGGGLDLQIGGARLSTMGKDGGALAVKPSGKLEMQGRAVFNFAAQTGTAQIRDLLDETGLELEDIDLFLLHQGSRYIVETIARRLGVPAGKVPLGITENGNTVSSSIPLMLEAGANQSARRILLCGFGVGLSCASMVLTKDHND
ncbi:ketoacyl-ACP synthase III [Methyloceanibacter sp. wino2]|uniref:ketoacyl-ACP synthase III n=1 Tax=Methyloceanibacter sp. wino2 TaxID=2170729 RepID=UPI001ABAA4AA|nr:ketoacyl-ACP synthase III [Methyloceanibacter sp. wino2]